MAYSDAGRENRPVRLPPGGKGRLRGILRLGELSPMQVAAGPLDSSQDALQPRLCGAVGSIGMRGRLEQVNRSADVVSRLEHDTAVRAFPNVADGDSAVAAVRRIRPEVDTEPIPRTVSAGRDRDAEPCAVDSRDDSALRVALSPNLFARSGLDCCIESGHRTVHPS